MKHIKFLIIILVYTSLFCCKNDNKKDVEITEDIIKSETSSNCPKYILDQKKNNLNISVLLDLSDRIEETKIKQKDSAYLSSLAKSFVAHVQHKKLVLLEDRIQLFFNPEPSDEKINDIAKKLKVIFTKNTAKDQIEETISLYKTKPSKLYDLAKLDAQKAGGYPGSDIWRFFKDDIKDYCIDNCHRNILVILTDGYMFYDKTVMKEKNRTSYLTPKSLNQLQLNKSNWKDEIEKKDLGFIPATIGLNDLEVLVIGIASHNDENNYAQDIIEVYWKKWFDEMGVKKYKIKNADIPSSIEKVISDFILKA
ncbi:hypothetical protein Q4Q35_07630 [Flavivirga aquimarina]|uniref:VWFA domain-containing protein n=1 Tax=Flavivirga aquimarina TaxID=2027862 RepID=A0ABT8W990_9FLAO|nr:hypothetical protein [Flavivirga aquimarina]MDO5969674.1 hypothetical protein [Flavivirga aquimarina]